VRTVLTHSGLPAHFWAEAAAYTIYTRNRVPCGPLHEIPEDKWRNRTLSHQHMQPFGCKAFYPDHKLPSKLAPRYIEGILLGYVEGTHNYRIWDNKRSKVIISRDVVFTTLPVNSGVLTPVDNNIVPVSHTKTGSDQITLPPNLTKLNQSSTKMSQGCADQSMALVQLRLRSAKSGRTTREHNECGRIDD